MLTCNQHRIPLLTFFILLAPALAIAAPNLNILVLHSYSQEYLWTKGQHQGFVNALRDNYPGDLLIETEFLDSERNSLTTDYISKFSDYLIAKYRGFKPAAIYATDDIALDFSMRHLTLQFPTTPLFFSGVNDQTVIKRIQGKNITGVLENKEIIPNLKLLNQMNRHTDKLVVVGDNSSTYRAIERDIRNALSRQATIDTTYISSDRIEEILTALSQHPNSDLIFTTLGKIKDEKGRNLTLRETVSRIVDSGNRLIISMEDTHIYDGVLGGYVTSSRLQGTAAANLILGYLKSNELPAPIRKSPNEYLIDYRELERRGLSLPNSLGSAVTLLHPPAKLYQSYYHYILASFYILLALLLFSVISFLSVLTRKNRLIEQRSIDLEQQIDITRRTKEGLDEAQRLAKQGSWEWDLNTSEFRRSDGLIHLYKSCTDIDGNSLEKFRHTLSNEVRTAFEATVDQLRNTGHSVEYTHRLKTKEGQLRVMQETIRLVNHANGQPSRLIGTVQDITEQHHAQALLRESEEKYRLLFEMSEDPMLLVVEQEIVTANRAAARALGFEAEQRLIGMHLAELAPERQPDGQASTKKAAAMVQTALERGYHRLEWEFRNQEGNCIQVETSLTRIPYVGKNAIYCIWRDITEIKRIQEALKQKSAYLDGILSSSERVSIIATNPEGTIQYYNQTAEKLFGMPAERAVGVNLLEIHRAQGVDNSRNRLGLERAKEDGEYRFTLDMRQTDGLHHIDARVSPIYSDSHEFAGYMLMCEDVTEQRRASELIAYQASYDSLTDLPNRRMFLDNLQQAIARTRRHHHKGAVLFLDLDNFKNINDSLGHPVGDILLQQVAQRMWGTIREEDTVARLGGDEFVILMPELSKDSDEAISEVQMLANKIRTTMALPYHVDDHELHITTSIGIAVFPATGESPDDILRQADTAMYRAKESGRNAVRYFLPSMQFAAEERHKILNELRQAIPRNELRVFYQAQFNVEKQLCSIEALLRWQHPKRGLVMPSGFIPQAEESSLILEIGDWVLHEALIQYKAWRARYPQALRGRIAINVSALQFRQHDFIHKIKRSLTNTGADPDWLTLEMTESMLLKDFDETVEKIDYLKQLGVRFSIDDFGTGYSSLAYLKRLPVDEIKIDRSFVRDVIEDPNDAALVETIITLAQQTDLQTVAEGVETNAVFDFLRQHGCDLFQGFYLARPCDKNNFNDLYLKPLLAAPATENPK